MNDLVNALESYRHCLKEIPRIKKLIERLQKAALGRDNVPDDYDEKLASLYEILNAGLRQKHEAAAAIESTIYNLENEIFKTVAAMKYADGVPDQLLADMIGYSLEDFIMMKEQLQNEE